ncbi:MAG: redoxin domain-containing protein [Terracidiphilus sp.]|jgi:thiol-disulfide isomerase/thioredoxin
MRRFVFALTISIVAFCLTLNSTAQTPATAPQSNPTAPGNGPADQKAKKTFDEATKLMQEHKWIFALDGFRKADKQDGGHCVICEYRAWNAAAEMGDFKAARTQAEAMLAQVTNPVDKATAKYLLGRTYLAEGIRDKHDGPIALAETSFNEALQLRPKNADYLYSDATALAYLKRDDAARSRFEEFLKVANRDDIDYARAQRFVVRPELARAKMAPNFRLTTLDGRTLTLESLTGKVVLIDFWATWCGPCREALPHIRQIAKKFDGQPLAVLSISLDSDEAKWKEFVGKNGMTWMQYRDGGFEGRIAKQFNVMAIPATFTIDADGVLEDQHVGDADIEGKLKKLIAGAVEVANRKAAAGSVPIEKAASSAE